MAVHNQGTPIASRSRVFLNVQKLTVSSSLSDRKLTNR